MSPRCINQIVNGKRAITASTALGLGEAIGPSPHFWMALQADYDIERARAKATGTDATSLGARPRKPLPANGWAAPFDGKAIEGEEVNLPNDEWRHDGLGIVGQRLRRP